MPRIAVTFLLVGSNLKWLPMLKQRYLIEYYDLPKEGVCSDFFLGEGWYIRVSEFQPWGPFPSQKEAIESLLIEWPRFEDGFWAETKEGVSMADFSNIEVIDNPDGGATIIFDLDNETIKELEDALGISYNSPQFLTSFQSFVEESLKFFVMKNKDKSSD